MKKINLLAAFALTGLALFSSCKDDDDKTPAPQVATVEGESKSIGTNGTLKTWARTTDGKVDQVGISMNDAAFNTLTADQNMVMSMLTYPSVVSTQTGIQMATIEWNPTGHEPAQVYTTPHFDFHFYMISHNEMMAIPGGPDTIAVNPSFIPANHSYGPPGTPAMSVPAMGVHYVDMTSPEFTGGAFTKTFIYGYSRGSHVFLEPMVTKAYFETHPNATTSIPQPAAYQRSGISYPTKYTVRHDASAGQYQVILEGFVKR